MTQPTVSKQKSCEEKLTTSPSVTSLEEATGIAVTHAEKNG